MKQYVTIDKRSKKAQKEYYTKLRGTWGELNPVTRRMIMSNAKRRDNKGRVLQMGESQQDDGRYVYRYMTPFGQRKAVYSWRLTASDPTPTGKRKEKSLRERIKDIEKELRLETFCEDLTVCELVEKYLATKTGVKLSTRTGYKFVQNILDQD